MCRTKAAAAADMETAADRHRHSHWPDFAYQCNAIVVLLLLLLLLHLLQLICSQLASLLHAAAIWNLQSATQSLLNNGKMKLLENDCQTEKRPPKQWPQCLPSSSCHTQYIRIYISYFEASQTKCLASWDCFSQRLCFAWSCLAFFISVSPLSSLLFSPLSSFLSFPSFSTRVDNQASAYKTQCL